MKTRNDFTRMTRAASQRAGSRASTAGSVKARSAAWADFSRLPHILATNVATDSRPGNFGENPVLGKPIDFGAPESKGIGTSQNPNSWRSLLHSAARGSGVSLGGGSLLESISGLGGLISGIAGLFGGGNDTIRSLERFELPSSKEKTLYLGGSTVATSGLESIVSVNGSVLPSNSGNGPQISSQQIVQAVKQALLTSSSLNDVIGEI